MSISNPSAEAAESVAKIHELQPTLDDPRTILRPARVVDLIGSTPVVEVGGERENARLALAFPYQPVVGDELLVIGQEGKFYVIGLLQTSGEVAFRFFGDVRLHAIGGRLELTGDEGVRLLGNTVEVASRKMKVVTESFVAKANDWYQRVRNNLDMHSGEKRELVDGDHSIRAEKASTVTSGIVTINGKEVHLG